MSFGQAVATCLTKYADFTGRARRSEYWWFFLFTAAVAGASYFINIALYVIAAIGLLIPGIAVAVRRLHDTGRSGLWFFVAFIPFVGAAALLVLLALPGTPGPNQFGPAPIPETLEPAAQPTQ